MDLTSPALLVGASALAGATLAAGAAWLVRQRAPVGNAAEAAGRDRDRRARELGWAYDETSVGDSVFSVRGEADGIKWKVRFRADRKRPNESCVLTWASRSVQGPATELRLLGRARYRRGKAHIEPAIERPASVILDPREIALAQARAEFAERTPPAEVGSSAFRNRFVTVARNHRLARSLVDSKVEGLLMQWPSRPKARPEDVLSIWLDWQGLRIDVAAPWTTMADIEHLVALGLAVATGYRRHAAAPGVTRWMETQPSGVT